MLKDRCLSHYKIISNGHVEYVSIFLIKLMNTVAMTGKITKTPVIEEIGNVIKFKK